MVNMLMFSKLLLCNSAVFYLFSSSIDYRRICSSEILFSLKISIIR